MRLTRPVVLAPPVLLCALLLAPATSFAYERRAIGDGKYDVVVGWDSEPAFVNQKNAAGIRISRAGTNPAEPVLGADRTLKLEIRQGADSRSFDLRAALGQPGYYVADLLPTRAGDYQWTFSGTLGADPIAETFDSADGKFGGVGASTAVQFPIAAPDPVQVTAELQATRAAAQTAQTLGVLGLGVGAVALLAVVVLWLTRPRMSAASFGSSPRALG